MSSAILKKVHGFWCGQVQKRWFGFSYTPQAQTLPVHKSLMCNSADLATRKFHAQAGTAHQLWLQYINSSQTCPLKTFNKTKSSPNRKWHQLA